MSNIIPYLICNQFDNKPTINHYNQSNTRKLKMINSTWELVKCLQETQPRMFITYISPRPFSNRTTQIMEPGKSIAIEVDKEGYTYKAAKLIQELKSYNILANGTFPVVTGAVPKQHAGILKAMDASAKGFIYHDEFSTNQEFEEKINELYDNLIKL